MLGTNATKVQMEKELYLVPIQNIALGIVPIEMRVGATKISLSNPDCEQNS